MVILYKEAEKLGDNRRHVILVSRVTGKTHAAKDCSRGWHCMDQSPTKSRGTFSTNMSRILTPKKVSFIIY